MGRLRDTLIPFRVVIINDVDFLSDYSCFIDKDSNIRMFFQDRQRYMRIGDLLSNRCIVRCIELSSYSFNCVFNFWAACDYQRCLMQKRFATSKPSGHEREERRKRFIASKNECDREKEERERDHSIVIAAKAATYFLEELSKAIAQVGPAEKRIRLDWLKWCIVDRDFLPEKSLAMQEYCLNQMDCVLEEEPGLCMDELVPLHRVLVMLASMQMFDERLHQWYLRITQGQVSIKQWLKPLAGNSAFSYWKSIDEMTRSWSLQGVKAESLLQMISIVGTVFGGKLPLDWDRLGSFQQMGTKKVAETLNSFFIYDHCGLGVDSHVLKCLYFFCMMEGLVDMNTRNKLWPMTLHIPARFGFAANNNIAEVAQQLRRGDKKWAQGVLDWLVDESHRKEQNKTVIKHWLEAYNKKRRVH